MRDYKARPLAAINEIGLTVESAFIPWSNSRNYKENAAVSDHSLNWSVALVIDGRKILETIYSSGIAHCPSYKSIKRTHGGGISKYDFEILLAEMETGFVSYKYHGMGSVRSNRKKPIKPDSVDVIYCLVSDASVIDYVDFADWADNYGYDSDSISAKEIYDACLSTALALRAGIGDEGFRKLQAAFEGY